MYYNNNWVRYMATSEKSSSNFSWKKFLKNQGTPIVLELATVTNAICLIVCYFLGTFYIDMHTAAYMAVKDIHSTIKAGRVYCGAIVIGGHG